MPGLVPRREAGGDGRDLDQRGVGTSHQRLDDACEQLMVVDLPQGVDDGPVPIVSRFHPYADPVPALQQGVDGCRSIDGAVLPDDKVPQPLGGLISQYGRDHHDAVPHYGVDGSPGGVAHRGPAGPADATGLHPEVGNRRLRLRLGGCRRCQVQDIALAVVVRELVLQVGVTPLRPLDEGDEVLVVDSLDAPKGRQRQEQERQAEVDGDSGEAAADDDGRVQDGADCRCQRLPG